MATTTPGQNQVTVLVVDDEESVRIIMGRLLTHMGYASISAPDGETAIEMVRVRALRIDCVLLDLAMPGMSGLETAAAVHALAPQLPLLIMSGHAIGWLMSRELEVPIAGFLQKPFAFDDLRRAIRAALTSNVTA